MYVFSSRGGRRRNHSGVSANMDLIELHLRFDGGAMAIIGGMTAVSAAALRGQWGGSTVVAPP